MWLSFLLRALLQLFLMLTVYLNVLWSDFILYTFSIVHSAPTTLASLMFFELPRKGTLRDYVLSVSAAWACSLPASRAQSLYPLTLSQITPLEFTPSLFTLCFSFLVLIATALLVYVFTALFPLLSEVSSVRLNIVWFFVIFQHLVDTPKLCI